jgi:hypothetical protein
MLCIKLYCIQTKKMYVTLCRYWSHVLRCSRPVQCKFNFSNFMLVLFVCWKIQWNGNEQKSYRLWENVENYGTAIEATDDNIILRWKNAICMPDNLSEGTGTHSFKSFSTASVVTPTRPNTTLCVHCLSSVFPFASHLHILLSQLNVTLFCLEYAGGGKHFLLFVFFFPTCHLEYRNWRTVSQSYSRVRTPGTNVEL